MGDLMSEIRDDINKYCRLCRLYNEEVIFSADGTPDCYGEHSKKLNYREKNKNVA